MLISILAPLGHAAGIARGMMGSSLGDAITQQAARKRRRRPRYQRNPDIEELLALDPEIGIPERIAMRVAQRRLEREMQDNPDFYAGRSGIVHPIRASDGYNEFMTSGARYRLLERRPEVLRQLETAGLSREPRWLQRGHAAEERQTGREHARAIRMVVPGWAHGWSQADLQGLADYAGLTAAERRRDDWPDLVKPEQVSEYRDHYLSRRRSYGLPPSRRERAHRRERQVRERQSLSTVARHARRGRSRSNPITERRGSGPIEGRYLGSQQMLDDEPIDLFETPPLSPEEEAAIEQEVRRQRLAALRALPKSGKRRRRRTRVRPRDFVQGPQLSLFGDRAASDLRPHERGTYQYRFGNPNPEANCVELVRRRSYERGRSYKWEFCGRPAVAWIGHPNNTYCDRHVQYARTNFRVPGRLVHPLDETNPLRQGEQEAVSANIRQLYHEHGDEKAWPRERILAAAENAARGDRSRVNPNVLTLSCARCGAHHQVLRGATHFTCRSCGSGNGIRRRR